MHYELYGLWVEDIFDFSKPFQNFDLEIRDVDGYLFKAVLVPKKGLYPIIDMLDKPALDLVLFQPNVFYAYVKRFSQMSDGGEV